MSCIHVSVHACDGWALQTKFLLKTFLVGLALAGAFTVEHDQSWLHYAGSEVGRNLSCGLDNWSLYFINAMQNYA